jgi:IMP dehydrogenase
MKLRTALSYDDVLLVPKYSEVVSRCTDITLESVLDIERNLKFKLPIITSPMDTITEDEMAIQMAKLGGLGIIHRYNTKEQQLTVFLKTIKEIPATQVGVAIGIKGDALERATLLTANGCKILCVDVAHGHLKVVGDFIQILKGWIPKDVHIMAGNIATAEGAKFLENSGADSLRVSVGSGSICSTRIQTGHGIPVWQSIADIVEFGGVSIPLIADGGIKNAGDFSKALAVGADFGMVGSLVSGTTETPGSLFTKDDGSKFKCYRGMASREAQNAWRGSSSSVEGISTFVRYKGPVEGIVRDLEIGLRSALSYSGAFNIKEFQHNAEFIIQTSGGQLESSTHILSKV